MHNFQLQVPVLILPRVRYEGGSYMVLRQHSRIDLSLLQHQSTSEEKHGRLLKRGSGDCRTFLCSVTQRLLKKGRESTGPFPEVSVQ